MLFMKCTNKAVGVHLPTNSVKVSSLHKNTIPKRKVGLATAFPHILIDVELNYFSYKC